MGDPSGIGPEIIVKALPKIHGLAEFLVIGDRWVFDQLPVVSCRLSDIRFIDLKNVKRNNFRFGKARAEYGRASIEYLDKALELIRKNKIDCLVTCPISKESINLAGFKYLGHTEYLTRHTATKYSVMMLLNKRIRFSLITRHIPLKEVSGRLNKDDICRNIRLTYISLRDLFSLPKPRLVVCGLNPHASDKGVIGKEENNIIGPALKELRKGIKQIDGPISADIAIAKAASGFYDCIIAMYHDQALIPLKLLGNARGVNLTLGLPFIRTSPLHGTAFDIAGKNLSSADSLIEAIKLAIRCASSQKKA